MGRRLAIKSLLKLVRDKDRQLEAFNERMVQLAGQVGFLQAKLQEAEAQIKLLHPPKPTSPNSGQHYGANLEHEKADEGRPPHHRGWPRIWPWKG